MSSTAPIIQFSGAYYPQVYRDLILWMRANVAELTEEDVNDPAIQLLAAYAMSAHNMAVLLDHVAEENFISTAKLRESVKRLLKLIGVEVKEDIPATARVIATFSAATAAAVTFFKNSLFATRSTGTTKSIDFEFTGANVSIPRTDQVGKAWQDDGGVFTDVTAEANGVGGPKVLWANTPTAGDAFYFGHAEVVWDKVKFELAVQGSIWGVNDHVWEYYDGQVTDIAPTTVTNPGGGNTLEFDLTSLLGTKNRAGSVVRCSSLLTGTYEDITSVFSASVNKATTTTLLGQTTPSTVAGDYLIGVAWKEVPNGVETVESGAAGDVIMAFDLPETATRKWQKTKVNAVEEYWMRLRVVVTTGGTAPSFDRIRITEGSQYFTFSSTQGRTVIDDPAGTGNGVATQVIKSSQGNIIDATTKAFVNEGGGGFVEWTKVSDFLASTTLSRHFTVEFDEDGFATYTFGDGKNGRVVANGDVIKLEYRVGADQDGNTPANTITTNKSGAAFIRSVTNPRAAAGWAIAEGSTDVTLDDLRISGPAQLRAIQRILTEDDAETLAIAFVASDGSKPVVRAKAVAEGSGEKTIKLIVVGTGSNALTTDQVTALKEDLNGSVVKGLKGKVMTGISITAANYVKQLVSVTVVITGGDTGKVKTALEAFLSPLAKKSDGTFLHSFAGTIDKDRIEAECFIADPNVTSVNMTVPAGDVVLGADSLPAAGTLTVTKA